MGINKKKLTPILVLNEVKKKIFFLKKNYPQLISIIVGLNLLRFKSKILYLHSFLK